MSTNRLQPLAENPENQPEAGIPKACNPADANGCAEWIATLAGVGLTPVVVVIPYCAPLWSNSGFEETIGGELRAAKLGHFDSAQYGNPIEFFFYLSTRKLDEARAFLTRRIGEIGLSDVAKITLAEDYVPAPKQ